MPFTSQVTVAVLVIVESVSVTTAVNGKNGSLMPTVCVVGVIATEAIVVVLPLPPHACRPNPPAIAKAIMARERTIGDRARDLPHSPAALCATVHFPIAFKDSIGFGQFIETLSPRGFQGCREV